MARKFNKQSWLINQLRRITLRYPPRIRALTKVKTTYYIKSKMGKDLKRVSFQCQKCGTKDLKSTQIAADHIQPVIKPSDGFLDWNNYIERLFCEEEGFSILCHFCHDIKTRLENEQRK